MQHCNEANQTLNELASRESMVRLTAKFLKGDSVGSTTAACLSTIFSFFFFFF